MSTLVVAPFRQKSSLSIWTHSPSLALLQMVPLQNVLYLGASGSISWAGTAQKPLPCAEACMPSAINTTANEQIRIFMGTPLFGFSGSEETGRIVSDANGPATRREK